MFSNKHEHYFLFEYLGSLEPLKMNKKFCSCFFMFVFHVIASEANEL